MKLHFILPLLLIGQLTFAQTFPKLSPTAKIEQKVGLCTITIEYSRPSVKGRKIFGDLVPYEEVWRLGANECTKFTIDQPIMFGSNQLDTGTYALFAIPGSGEFWEIIFNSDYSQWGSNAYDENKNVLQVDADATISDCFTTETFNISIEDITNYSANIVFKWEQTKVTLPFIVDTDKQIDDMIAAAVKKGEELDKVHYKAASYFLKNMKDLKDLDRAMEHIDQSIEIEKTYSNLFVKAQILAAQGNLKEANKLGEEAKKMAINAEKKDWAEYMQKKMDEWGNKK
ncbi:MAG: DUF2911 domain-containing protein [Crocinitomicaceae bacterium]|nr:DUF2911 domain-containing protein [Crocinitomicaceae bacterium]